MIELITAANGNVPVNWFALCCILAPVAYVLFLLVRSVGRYFAAAGREMRVASAPIPSPAQISAQLQAEWGRPATIEEVAAVHQMLTSRHNQALVNSGIALGALYLMGHHGNL